MPSVRKLAIVQQRYGADAAPRGSPPLHVWRPPSCHLVFQGSMTRCAHRTALGNARAEMALRRRWALESRPRLHHCADYLKINANRRATARRRVAIALVPARCIDICSARRGTGGVIAGYPPIRTREIARRESSHSSFSRTLSHAWRRLRFVVGLNEANEEPEVGGGHGGGENAGSAAHIMGACGRNRWG